MANWFVSEERRNWAQQDMPASRLDAEVELSQIEAWATAEANVFAIAKKVIESEGIDLDVTSPTFRSLQRMLHKAWIEAERRQVNRWYPVMPMGLDSAFASLSHSTAFQRVAKSTVASAMDAMRRDPTRSVSKGKTADKRKAQWRVLLEFFGKNSRLSDITRQRVREFMALLERVPSNSTKHFPGRSIVEAAELGVELPKMSPETANGYLRQLGAIFRYAVNEGMVDIDPTAGLLFQKSKVKAKDKRLPFSTNDLRAIFGAPLFTGCMNDERGYNRSGPNIVRRGRFWVPLIALYSGMRLNEICQLTLDDFEQKDGIDIIQIRASEDGDDTKRAKTEAGIRFVPVHDELRRIGLMRYVQNRRENDTPMAPLFPELPMGSTGYRSDPFSKFFALFLDKVGVSHPKKVFHSFRHNYRDAMREARLSDETVRALGGWSSGRTEHDYGTQLTARSLAKDIRLIRYPDLDLSHLHQRSG